MADPHGFLEVHEGRGGQAAGRRAGRRLARGLRTTGSAAARRRGVPAGPQVHGLRNPVLPLGNCRLSAGQPDPRMERPGPPRPVGCRERPAACHQQLPGIHRPPVPRPVRVGLRAVHRRRARPAAASPSNASNRPSPITRGWTASSSLSRPPSQRARASPSSAPVPRDWPPRNNSPAPDTTSRCMSATTGWAA